MSRLLRASLLFLVLASCAGGQFSAPRNLDDACALSAERPTYYRAMKAAERKWGVPVPVQMAVIHQESKFVGNAKTPHVFALGIIPMGRMSSAYGYSQALDGTWEEYKQDQGRFGARRDRIQDATDFMGWYFDQSTRELGISKYDAGEQYLAYHEGRRGYVNGSYRSKTWLLNVVKRIDARSERYRAQLAACGKL